MDDVQLPIRPGRRLMGQKKYIEAEPLLLAGYLGMKVRAANSKAHQHLRLAEAGDRLVRLYEALGKPEEAIKWRSRLGLGELPAEVFARP